MNLYLELATFPTELAESSFVYELYKNSGTSPVIKGNFSGRKEGDTITLLSNQILNTSKDTYTLYIYIDGTQDNPGTMAGKNFLFKLWGSGEGAIYKENVMTTSDNPTSSTSKFFNTDVMREEIKSLTIAEDNTVPDTDGVVSKDISSNKDGTVMLWYIPKEVTSSDGTTKTMYDVWIGGKNGILQTGANASNMFAYLTNVEKLDLSKLDTSYITNMSRMFYMSSGLKSIDLSNFNTSKVTDMTNMFEKCSSLINLDLTSFDTSSVIIMNKINGRNGGMFNGCKSLKKLNVGNFNTSKITNMSNMFKDCSSLTELDLSSFDTNNVTSMFGMFEGCSKLKSLDLSSFNTSNVEELGSNYAYGGMFQGCSSLTELDLSNFDTSKVKRMGNMFKECSSLEKLDLSSFNTSSVVIMDSMFQNCSSLIHINLSSFNTGNVTTMSYMFADCSSLVSLDLSSFNTSKVTNMFWMFFHDSSLKKIYVSDLWNIDNVTNYSRMFENCYLLQGATTYDKTKTDVSMANYTTGYLTYKSNN